MRLATAFEVFDEIVGAGLEGSIHARRFGQAEMDFTVTLSLVDRTEQQLACGAIAFAVIVLRILRSGEPPAPGIPPGGTKRHTPSAGPDDLARSA